MSTKLKRNSKITIVTPYMSGTKRPFCGITFAKPMSKDEMEHRN